MSQKSKNLEECADRALEQIERKGYDKVLVARQIDYTRIRKYGFAFEGKKVLIKEAWRELIRKMIND